MVSMKGVLKGKKSLYFHYPNVKAIHFFLSTISIHTCIYFHNYDPNVGPFYDFLINNALYC